MLKYDADGGIMITYENLLIVWSQFFTDMLIFIYIWSNSNILWLIGIQIQLVFGPSQILGKFELRFGIQIQW